MRGEALARRVRSYAQAAYGWALKAGLVEHNPFATIAPIGCDTRRERFLTDAQLAEVWRATSALGWPWGSYFRFLLLTLCREAETAGLRRAELSLDFAQWEIPGSRTKNGKAHLVHLSEPARAILRAAKRVKGSHLVFTTTGTTPINGFSNAKERLDAEIVKARAATAKGRQKPEPLVLWRLHDFRLTGVTTLVRLGVRWEVTDKLLNHTAGAIHGVAAIYQKHEFHAERAAALRAWADHVLAVGEGQAAECHDGC